MSNLLSVLLSEIKPNPIKLREVDINSVEFQQLVDSVRDKGVLQSISIRPSVEGGYELIDGLHRYTAATHAGLTDIPCIISDVDDNEVLVRQIIGNVQRVDTKYADLAAQFKTILHNNMMWTEGDLAKSVNMSTAWIRKILKLTKIENEKISVLINEGEITMLNALALTNLPVDEHESFLEQAQLMEAADFAPIVAARCKELKEAARQAREPKEAVFTAVPRMLKLAQLKVAMNDRGNAESVVLDSGIESPVDAFMEGVRYSLSMDKAAIVDQETRWNAERDAKKAATAERAEKRKEAREKKAAANAEAAEEAKVEA